jgi:hypothetical protein
VTAYNALATQVEKGEYRKAYERLSTPTRQLLEARAKALHADSGGALKDDPASVFFSSNTQVASPDDIRLVSDDGRRAVLHVRSRRGEQDLVMVREDSSWKLDLTEALHE